MSKPFSMNSVGTVEDPQHEPVQAYPLICMCTAHTLKSYIYMNINICMHITYVRKPNQTNKN